MKLGECFSSTKAFCFWSLRRVFASFVTDYGFCRGSSLRYSFGDPRFWFGKLLCSIRFQASPSLRPFLCPVAVPRPLPGPKGGKRSPAMLRQVPGHLKGYRVRSGKCEIGGVGLALIQLRLLPYLLASKRVVTSPAFKNVVF